jgi:hypothetical protein
MTASKNGKVTSTKDSINTSLVAELSAIPAGSLSGELIAFERGVSLMSQGVISVRGLKASIVEAEKVGALPTIRSSWAEHFPAVATVRALKGGNEVSLRASFAVVVNGKRRSRVTGLQSWLKVPRTSRRLQVQSLLLLQKIPALLTRTTRLQRLQRLRIYFLRLVKH